jgi:hypothetical protein
MRCTADFSDIRINSLLLFVQFIDKKIAAVKGLTRSVPIG